MSVNVFYDAEGQLEPQAKGGDAQAVEGSMRAGPRRGRVGRTVATSNGG